jgi:nitrogenase molybdenum-iron protein alpha/beta subunit
VEAFIASQLEHARPQLAKVSERFRGLRVAVFAETPLAAGLCGLLMEMGMLPVWVGLRDESLGGRQALEATLAADGFSLPEDAQVSQRPSLRCVRKRILELAGERKLHGIFGSAVELGLLRTFSARELSEIYPDFPAQKHILFELECGFPSSNYHLTHATPSLGFGGAVAWAQRILNTPH